MHVEKQSGSIGWLVIQVLLWWHGHLLGIAIGEARGVPSSGLQQLQMKCGNPREYIYIYTHVHLLYICKYIYIYLYVRPELGQALECWSIKSIPGRLGQPKTYQQVDSSQHQFVTKEAVLFTTNNFPPKTPNKARNKASKAGLQGKWEWITP